MLSLLTKYKPNIYAIAWPNRHKSFINNRNIKTIISTLIVKQCRVRTVFDIIQNFEKKKKRIPEYIKDL